MRLERLGSDLLVAYDGHYRALLAQGREGVIAFNTLSSREAAEALRDAAPGQIRTLVCTIDHLDHAGHGAYLAPNAEVLAHELTARVIAGRGAPGQLPATRTIAGDGELLELDGLSVHLLYPGPTQGTGNLAVQLPEQRVLFLVGPQENARYGLLPDVHLGHVVGAWRRLLTLDFDTVVAGRYGLMTRAGLERACDYIDGLLWSGQKVFADGVALWDIRAVEEYATELLSGTFGSLDGFREHVGIGCLRAVHHYLMGGWGLEDSLSPDRLLEQR